MPWIGGDKPLNQEQMENNADIVISYLNEQGYEQNTMAAILGNLENESTINPNRQEVGGIGYGLVGWTPVDVLINACNVLGLSPYTDGNNQLIVIDAQILGKSGLNTWYSTEAFIRPYYNSGATTDMIGITGQQFKENSMNWLPDKLAVLFMVCYERPSYDPEVNHWNRRMESANKWFEYITGHPPKPREETNKLPIWAYCRLF